MKNYISISMMLFSFVLATAQIVKPEAGEPTYIIDGGMQELTSEGDITLLPGSWIKTGSTFRASIVLGSTSAEDSYTSFIVPDENYILTRVYHTAFDDFNPAFAKEGDAQEQLTYLDGLGRPIQQLAIKATPDKKDIITHIAYDDFGRTPKQYLPYKAVLGDIASLRSNVIPDLNTHYRTHYGQDILAGNENPFSEIEYESSPLNRTLRQAAPGYDWRMDGEHEVSFSYDTNSAQEVRYFDARTHYVGEVNKPTLIHEGYYHAGELYKVITYDENHTIGEDHSTEEFTDKQGRIVLKRTYDNEVAHDTYYIYDDFGNLSFVIPPKVSTETINSAEFTELMYQYIYDHRNRLIEKKIPGKGWEYIVYNKLDQPYMTQDPNLRVQDQWLFTTYDPFGRVAYTGIDFNTSDRKAVQEAVDGMTDHYVVAQTNPTTHAGTSFYYSKLSYPVNFTAVYTINYYDNYNTTRDGLIKPTGNIYEQDISSDVQGLSTVNKVRVLGTDDWITTLTAYDGKGRPIYVQSNNEYLNTNDIVKTEVDFAGKVLRTHTTHNKNGQVSIVTTDIFAYDHEARLIQQEQELNGGRELIYHNTYDPLGVLIKKRIGNTLISPLQEIDYSYNVRGWLKGINDQNLTDNVLTINSSDLFGYKIDYNTPEVGTPLYNGNISRTQWRSQNEDKNPRAYSYTYDALNRIKNALDSTGDSRYSLTGISYDKNGNILSLSRNGHLNETFTSFGIMDDLVYSYDTGNKLTKVLDNGHDAFGFKDRANETVEYTYDANGNMLADANKGISSIEYNYLNLPTKVTVNGNGNDGTIDYVYSADGVKLKKTISTTGVKTLYANGYLYEGSTLQFFPQTEGYVSVENGSYKYVYNYKDHLGNVRLSYTDANNDGNITQNEIIRESNYYPFGMAHKGYNKNVNSLGNSIAKKFMFGGKEYQDELGIAWMDFGARNYDASLGRWMNTDPLEQFHSPYVYAGNDPIRYMDPTGMYSTEEWKKDNGITDDDLTTVYQAPKDEYDKNGNKISNLGGDETDFYHQENGDTKVVNRKSKKSNTISGGENIIKGYVQRNGKTSFWAIFNEFLKGTGPEKSIMYGKGHQMNEGIIDSYQFFRAAEKFLSSDKNKMLVKGTFGIFGAIRSGTNGVEQMLGKANISMYKLGNNVVFLVTDAKSRSSWSLNPFDGDEVNVPRQQGKIIPKSNTHQTYIFSLTTKQVKDAIEAYDISHSE